ncbi:cation transporter [Demequina sp. NBRC 110055]|uniref:cation transporter n=1 Tax=Demequina sp. NBRC 110055 TaxID=1570344 RepID=UPI000A07BC3A|nr:cation diffusion facilitator family transporter [Demequina sp. NBRC 110055]
MRADPSSARLRRAVGIVAALNFGYFFVEFSVALAAGSVALLADSVDFLEDAAVNALLLVALGMTLARRALAAKVMAGIILIPALVAAFQVVRRLWEPTVPHVLPVVLAASGAIVVNGVSAWLLVRVHHHGGSLGRAAFLSARNDVLVNAAIIAMALLTAWTGSGWPDVVLGVIITGLAVHAAFEVWELSEAERLDAAARELGAVGGAQ